AMYGVKVCTSPNLPNNEGAFRPITLEAPPGSIVNPQFPAPGGSRMLIGHYVPMLVFGCLGQIVPERVMASCGSPMWGMNQSDVRDDGISCLSWPSNVSSTSIEISEHIAPLRFHHKKLRPDSGGAGRHRGGLGQEILIESRSESPIAVSFLAERTIFPAFGIEGGRDGAPGELHINGVKTDPKKQYVLQKGDTVSLGTRAAAAMAIRGCGPKPPSLPTSRPATWPSSERIASCVSRRLLCEGKLQRRSM